MKSPGSSLFAAMLLLLLLAACGPRPYSSNAVPVTGAQVSEPTPTTEPNAIASQPSLADTLQSLTVAHPPMQVGSIERYFDGSLLDAVPNDGPFLMGPGGANGLQKPITVSDFWIYGTEVSNQMYAWCVSLGKCTPPDASNNPGFGTEKYGNYPVVGVTWQQASDYCAFANGRLPTEAEWEKAASWDATQKQKRLYPWGSADPSCDLLNFKYCLNHATSVTSFGQGQSFYGVYNMAGNVSEWVQDWYQPNYLANAPATDPSGPQTGTMRVIRSNGYDSDAVYAAPTARFADQPSAQRPDLGFRCVVKDPAYFAPFCTAPVFYGPDMSSGGISSKPCPDPQVVGTEWCTADNQPMDFVTVLNTDPTIVQVTGLQSCDPPNADVGVRHQCAPGTTITVTASCNTMPNGSAACPPNYRQDPNNPKQCLAPPAAGVCPTGFQFDAKLQCCSAAPGSTVPAPPCAVGQHLYSGVCVSDYGGPIGPASITFTTGAMSCIMLTPGPAWATLIPYPNDITGVTPPPLSTLEPPTLVPPTPGPTNTPHVKCDLKPKDCTFGVDKVTCTCKLFP